MEYSVTSVIHDEGNMTIFKNTTDEAEGRELKQFLSSFRVIAPIAFGVITLIGLLGNTLVIYITAVRDRMQSRTNIMLFNLALADLLFLLVCPTFSSYRYATSKLNILAITREFVCKAMHYLVNVTVYVTIYTLVLISAVRYVGIVHPDKADRFITKKTLIMTLCGIWITTLCVNAPVIFVYRMIQNYCEFHKNNFGREFYTIFFFFAYLLPLSTIAVLSVCVWRHMRKNVMTTQRESLKRQAKVGRLLVAVVAAFAVCWMPIQFMLLLRYWEFVKFTHTYGFFLVLGQSLAYLNSCLNPIIYNFASKEFRQHFNETLCCVCRKCRNS